MNAKEELVIKFQEIKERGWIEKTRNAKTIKGETEGMLFYDAPEKVMLNKNFAINSMYPIISGRIWGRVDNPADVYQALCDKFFRHVSGEREGEIGWDTNLGVFLETPGDSDYIEWATAQYNKYKQHRG